MADRAPNEVKRLTKEHLVVCMHKALGKIRSLEEQNKVLLNKVQELEATQQQSASEANVVADEGEMSCVLLSRVSVFDRTFSSTFASEEGRF